MKKILMSLLMIFALGVAVIPSYPTQGAEMKVGVYTPMFADNALENARLRDILKSDTEIFIQLNEEINTLKETIENKNLIIKDNEKTIERLKNSGSGEVKIEYVPVGKLNTEAYNDLVNTINSLKAEKEELERRNADLSEKLAFRSYYDSAYYEVDETNKSLTKENKYLTDTNKSLEEQLKDALAKIAELEDDNTKLHVAVDNYETALFDTKAVVESQDKTITSLKDELNNTVKELEARTKDVDEANKKVEELTTKLERQEETIKGIVADLNTEIEMKNLEIEGLKQQLAESTDVDVTEYVSKIDALNKQVEELNEKIEELNAKLSGIKIAYDSLVNSGEVLLNTNYVVAYVQDINSMGSCLVERNAEDMIECFVDYRNFMHNVDGRYYRALDIINNTNYTDNTENWPLDSYDCFKEPLKGALLDSLEKAYNNTKETAFDFFKEAGRL